MFKGLGRAAWYRTSVGLLLTFAAVTIAALSPLAMVWVADLPVQWAPLAEVGQAYGGASALLSALALSGIAISILIQRHQNRISQLYSLRQRQFEIVKLALESPEYLYVDGPLVVADKTARLKVYANLLVGHWAMVWDLGEMGDDWLRLSAGRLFDAELAREWWMDWGSSYLGPRRRRKFVEILTQECEQASRRARPVLVDQASEIETKAEAETFQRRTTDGAASVFATGVVVGVLFCLAKHLVRRRTASQK